MSTQVQAIDPPSMPVVSGSKAALLQREQKEEGEGFPHFRIPVSELKRILQAVQSASDPQIGGAAFSGVLLRVYAGHLEAFSTDGVNSCLCSADAKTLSDGTVLLPLRFLIKALANLSDQEISIKVNAKSATVKHSCGSFRVQRPDESASLMESAYAIMSTDVNLGPSLMSADLRRLIKAVGPLAHHQTKGIPTGSRVVWSKTSICFEATDARATAQCSLALDSGINSGHNDFEPAMVSASGLKVIASNTSEEAFRVSRGPSRLELIGMASKMKIGLLDVKFPNINSLWDTRPAGGFIVAGGELQRALQRFANQEIPIIHIRTEGEQLIIKGSGDYSSNEEYIPIKIDGTTGPIDIRLAVGYVGELIHACKDADILLTAAPSNHHIFIHPQETAPFEFRYILADVK